MASSGCEGGAWRGEVPGEPLLSQKAALVQQQVVDFTRREIHGAQRPRGALPNLDPRGLRDINCNTLVRTRFAKKNMFVGNI